ncbi:hypothetical protein Hanom_Chr14g01292521 [Helianthus anomalus]
MKGIFVLYISFIFSLFYVVIIPNHHEDENDPNWRVRAPDSNFNPQIAYGRSTFFTFRFFTCFSSSSINYH